MRRYLSSDVRGGLLSVTPPWVLGLYLGLIAAVALGIAIAGWGRVRVYSRGRGIIRPNERVLVVRSPMVGTVKAAGLRPGVFTGTGDLLLEFEDYDVRADPAIQGEEYARLVALRRERLKLRVPREGILDYLAVREGDWVEEGQVVARVVPVGARLIGYMALREQDRPYLRLGQIVRLKFDAYPYQEMGIGIGKVTRIAEDLVSPESKAELQPLDVPASSVVVEVSVDTLPPRATPAQLQNGMLFYGEVVLRERRILALLMKPLVDLVGG